MRLKSSHDGYRIDQHEAILNESVKRKIGFNLTCLNGKLNLESIAS